MSYTSPRRGDVFTVTEQHIRLLRHAYVVWTDCETGAPAIDPKRPYGTSLVAEHVLEILGLEDQFSYDEDEGLSTEQIDALLALHYETAKALQCVLAAGSFEPATYRYNDRWRWERTRTEDV